MRRLVDIVGSSALARAQLLQFRRPFVRKKMHGTGGVDEKAAERNKDIDRMVRTRYASVARATRALIIKLSNGMRHETVLTAFVSFQIQIVEGCRMPVKMRESHDWREFCLHSAIAVCIDVKHAILFISGSVGGNFKH